MVRAKPAMPGRVMHGLEGAHEAQHHDQVHREGDDGVGAGPAVEEHHEADDRDEADEGGRARPRGWSRAPRLGPTARSSRNFMGARMAPLLSLRAKSSASSLVKLPRDAHGAAEDLLLGTEDADDLAVQHDGDAAGSPRRRCPTGVSKSSAPFLFRV